MNLVIQLVGRNPYFLPLLTNLSDLFETEVVRNNGSTVNGWIANAGGWVGIKGNLTTYTDLLV